MSEDDDLRWYHRPDRHCRGKDTELWFPPRDKKRYKVIADQAKQICNGKTYKNPPCPVRVHCLLDAIKREEPHGIWGGMSHRERNALVRKWKSRHPDLELTDGDEVLPLLEKLVTERGR